MYNFIEKKSLGRPAFLGDQYDLRSDSFLFINVFKENIPSEKIQTVDTTFSSYEYQISSSSQEKFNSLGVDGNLKLSVLCGLIDVSGAASYLKDESSEKKVVRASLVYKIETKLESINFSSVKDLININNLKNQQSTHIVARIKYGANVVVTFEKSYSDESNKSEVVGSLGAAMKKLGGLFSINGDVKLNINENDRKLYDEFKIKFEGDIIPKGEEIPSSIETAIEIMKKMPIYLESINNGKGKPIEYHLVPIQTLQKEFSIDLSLERVFKSINEEIINSIEVDDQLDPVSSFINKVKVNEKEFKNIISNLIVDVRGGLKEMQVLEKCVREHVSSEYSSNGIKLFLEMPIQLNLKNQISFIKEIQEMKIDIISKTMNKSQILKNSDNNTRLYILNYWNSTRSNKEWDQIYISSFIWKYNEKRSNTKFAIIDHEIFNLLNVDVNENKTPFIELYINQKLKLSNFKIDPYTNFVERINNNDYNFNAHIPDDTFRLRMKCPGEDCKKEYVSWKCLVCEKGLKIDRDRSILYCSCGSYPVVNCAFKCYKPEHGIDYIALPKKDEKKYIDNFFILFYSIPDIIINSLKK